MLPNYTPYKNLPPLAGLCSIEEATKPGLPLEECVRRLKRFHYCFKRLHEILTARLTAEPIYELKTAFAHHAYLCAEHVAALRQRISEMREPPLGLEDVPHPALEVFFDEILCAPTTEELLCGYDAAMGMLQDAMENYMAETHPLTDAPSRRVLRFARLELRDMMDWGRLTHKALAAPDREVDWNEWEDYLGDLLQAAGGIDGAQTIPTPAGELRSSATPPQRGGVGVVAPPMKDHSPPPLPAGEGTVAQQPGVGIAPDPVRYPRRYSATPYTYDPVPQRDSRFADLWNQGVNAEAFLYDESKPARDKVLMMLFKRLREIDVPEMMASIIVQTKGKPWGYYLAMSRQLWDEARHAMMGEVGFVALGVDWTKARITWNWSYRLNTECTPLERHGVLFFIEQGLMPKTGKRYEFEVAGESGIPLAATIQDFDWADEVLHSQIGREWYVKQFGSLQEALDYGDKAWSKILSNWTTVKEKGLTEHANWWPAVYEQACAAAGREPDPTVLNYDETYEGKRADLRGVVGE